MDAEASNKPRLLMRTYRLQWERLQEFNLPAGCVCTSLSVNPVMGEIMFACRNRGLLHYAWNKEFGVVYADKPCRISYEDWGNVRLVKCEQESGAYAVVNDKTIALVTLGYQRSAPSSAQAIKTANNASKPGAEMLSHIAARYCHLAKPEDQHHHEAAQNDSVRSEDGPHRQANQNHQEAEQGTAADVSGGGAGLVDCVDFESERCSVGKVRDVAIDTENERIYLLYKDRLCRRLYPDMRSYSDAAPCQSVNRCIGSELVCLAQSRRILYLLNKSGDVRIRLKLERMTSATLDQLAWKTVGERLTRLVPGKSEATTIYGEIAKKLHPAIHGQSLSYPASVSSDSATSKMSVCLATIDAKLSGIPRAHRPSASSQIPDTLAAKRQLQLQADRGLSFTTDAIGKASNTVTTVAKDAEVRELPELAGACVDTERDILFASTGEPKIYALWLLNPVESELNDSKLTAKTDWWLEDSKIDLSGPPPARPFVAGPIACASTGGRRAGFLYAVDRQDCRRVLVIRYTVEPCIGAVGSSQ